MDFTNDYDWTLSFTQRTVALIEKKKVIQQYQVGEEIYRNMGRLEVFRLSWDLCPNPSKTRTKTRAMRRRNWESSR